MVHLAYARSPNTLAPRTVKKPMARAGVSGKASSLARHAKDQAEVLRLQVALTQARQELADLRSNVSRFRHLATHDSLTDLPNVFSIRERLEQAIQSSSSMRAKVVVFFMDLNDFKLVNDRHGHATGDEVLRIVAARLHHALRAEDVVGRMGGDEFACVISSSPSRAAVTRLAKMLLRVVSRPIQVGHCLLEVSASIGIAMLPDDSKDAGALLNHADAAMYCAKQAHSGHAFYASGMEAQWH